MLTHTALISASAIEIKPEANMQLLLDCDFMKVALLVFQSHMDGENKSAMYKYNGVPAVASVRNT